MSGVSRSPRRREGHPSDGGGCDFRPTPSRASFRSVEGVTATSPIDTTRRRISTAGALLLTLVGNIAVVAIGLLAVAGVAVAALAVFGPGILDAF